MIVSKITPGFVVQKFNTETGQYFKQEFIGGCEVEYENELGDPILPPDEMMNEDGSEPYLPFDMVQPEIKPDTSRCHICGGENH